MTNYHLGDFLIQVKNASRAGNKKISLVKTNLIVSAAEALKRLKFLDGIVVEGNKVTVSLSYKDKKPLLTNLKLISTPGLRIYKNVDEIAAYRGPSYFILSTPKGVLTNREAIKENTGGELIAEIY